MGRNNESGGGSGERGAIPLSSLPSFDNPLESPWWDCDGIQAVTRGDAEDVNPIPSAAEEAPDSPHIEPFML